MVTSGGARLIVYGFRRVRRSRSTDAFQTGDAGAPECIYHPKRYTGHADADQAGARPYLHRCAGTRSGDKDTLGIPPSGT